MIIILINGTELKCEEIPVGVKIANAFIPVIKSS